jgi:hypothetical protein
MSGTLKRAPISGASTDNTSMNKKQKKAFAKIEYEKMLKSQEPLSEWLDSLEREAGLETQNEIAEEDVGTFTWKKDGKKMGCCLTAMRVLLDTEELTSADSSSALKEQMESEWGPISEFPTRLEELAALLLQGAKLARDAGVDKIKAWDADDAQTEEEDGTPDEEEDEDEDEDENDDEDEDE